MTTGTKQIRIADLKVGDVVHEHGGRFQVTENARESQAHRPKFWNGSMHETLPGPCDCAAAKAVCVDGEIPGYFRPGAEWSLQGATFVMARVEVAA